jgi:hypothetical protein
LPWVQSSQSGFCKSPNRLGILHFHGCWKADCAVLTIHSLCICSILRIIYVFRVYYNTYDMTWESQPAWMWLAIEAEVAVICASAPALKLFFKNNMEDSSRGYGQRPSGYNNKGTNNSYDTAYSMERGGGKDFGKSDQWDMTSRGKVNTVVSSNYTY